VAARADTDAANIKELLRSLKGNRLSSPMFVTNSEPQSARALNDVQTGK